MFWFNSLNLFKNILNKFTLVFSTIFRPRFCVVCNPADTALDIQLHILPTWSSSSLVWPEFCLCHVDKEEDEPKFVSYGLFTAVFFGALDKGRSALICCWTGLVTRLTGWEFTEDPADKLDVLSVRETGDVIVAVGIVLGDVESILTYPSSSKALSTSLEISILNKETSEVLKSSPWLLYEGKIKIHR